MSDLREKVAEHLNYPNKDSVLAIDAADKIIELVKAECKVKIREAIQHNYACIHNGGRLKGLGDVILDIDEV